MTTKLFRWDDAGAPQLKASASMADTQGQMLAILDACLVNGYGDKTSLGWNLLYSATYKRVYQIPGGMCLHVEDGVTQSYWRALKVSGYDTMLDIDNGTGKFPTAAIINNGGSIAGSDFAWTYYADDGQSTVARQWIICGDEQGFWVWTGICSPAGGLANVMRLMYYFGNYPSNFTGDMYATMLTGAAPNAADMFTMIHNYGIAQTNTYSPRNGLTTCCSARKYDGIGGAVYTGLFAPGTATANYASLGCWDMPTPLPPISAKINLIPIDVLDCQAGYSSSVHQDLTIFRGRLPGVYLLNQASVGSAFDTFQDDSGNSYMLLPVANYQNYTPLKMVALQTSNWR